MNGAIASAVVDGVNANTEAFAALRGGARAVDEEHVCASCLADYFRRVFVAVRDRVAYNRVLDDPARLLASLKVKMPATPSTRSSWRGASRRTGGSTTRSCGGGAGSAPRCGGSPRVNFLLRRTSGPRAIRTMYVQTSGAQATRAGRALSATISSSGRVKAQLTRLAQWSAPRGSERHPRLRVWIIKRSARRK